MTAARKTQTGAKAGARRTSSTSRKAPARASGRASSSTTKRTSAPRRAPAAGRKNPARRRADHRALTVILIGTLVLASWTLYPVLRLQYQQERNKATLEQELAGLKARNEGLRAQVDRLKTPEGVEEAARRNLGLVKEGEQICVVTDGEETRAPAPDVGATTRSVAASETSVWLEVLDVVFGVR